MSGVKYDSYDLERAAKERLERERQRRLEEERKRQEEERRREAERLRQKLLAEEKARIGWAAEFQAKIQHYRLAALEERINLLHSLVEQRLKSAPQARVYLSHCAKLRELLKSTGAEESTDLGQTVEKMENEIHALISQYVSSNVNHAAEINGKREATEKLLERTKTYLGAFPEDLRANYQKELERLAKTVALAERERQTNFLYHHDSLKWAERELLHMFTTFETKRQVRKNNADRLRQRIDDLIIKNKMVQNLSTLPEHRERANSFQVELEALYLSFDPDFLEKNVARAQAGVEALFNDFQELQQREQERKHVLAMVEETLTEMGYEVVTSSDKPRPSPGSPQRMHFKTPDDEAIEASFGLNRSIHVEFKHALPENNQTTAAVSQAELIASCKEWCSDYDTLREQLRAKGVHLETKWRVEAENAEIQNVVFPSEVLKKKERRRRREDPKRRAMP